MTNQRNICKNRNSTIAKRVRREKNLIRIKRSNTPNATHISDNIMNYLNLLDNVGNNNMQDGDTSDEVR
jgi:hypothetical protein